MMMTFLKRTLLGLTVMASLFCYMPTSRAGDMPTAAGSPIAGISFDDRPLILPVQRNFQMAMLTVSSELGRSCGRMEAYGWRMDSQEQDRVNRLFNNTVDRMRAQGYVVESKFSSSISRDVTLFTADRTDRHLIFLWSAGEIGLVMVLCETSAPLSSSAFGMASREQDSGQPADMPSHLPMAQTIRSSKQGTQPQESVSYSAAGKRMHADFSPVGSWSGSYTCAQGTTGATLKIDKMKGDQFEGTFSFYPTAKNPYVPKGKYAVFGEYDADSYRILINPGKWMERPANFYSTIMIGSFDPVAKTFSGYFQGITGCTSFEADNSAQGDDGAKASSVKVQPKKAATPKKKATPKKVAPKPKKTTPAPEAAKKEPAADAKNGAAVPVSSEPADRSSSIEPPAGIQIGAPFAVQ
jgi:hypothetical protein